MIHINNIRPKRPKPSPLKFLVMGFLVLCFFQSKAKIKYFGADNKNIQYTGRIDFSKPDLPRFWAPGVYISAKFGGNYCDFIMNDQVPGAGSHNYLEIVLDGEMFRIKLKNKTDTVHIDKLLDKGEHVITICKSTESSIGYLEFVAIRCNNILPLPKKPKRAIEFIGDSITSGASNDLSQFDCNVGNWHDKNNAYLSYGPTTARNLNAQWHLSSVSGIGLMHSCCKNPVVLPQIYNTVKLRPDSLKWDFNRYQPDVVTVCLGQNDGKQDSVAFCKAYVAFLKQLRVYYPKADIVCLNSPMAESDLSKELKNYINGVVEYLNKEGDIKVSRFYFSKRFYLGCDTHPNIAEHALIAKELSAYLKELKHW